MSATGIDEAKLEAFMGQAVTDMGAIISAPLMVIGEKLGLYKAMAGAGPLTSQDVADRSGAAERYVREWLRNQAAGGYVTYDPSSDTYTLPDEHALALADEDSPFYVLGAYELIASVFADEERLRGAFRTGEGIGWHEHDHRLFRGVERFFRPGYRAYLVDAWIESSTPDVDLQATVSEVRPDGHETFVQDGWLRASERKLATTSDNMFKQAPTSVEPIPTFLASDVQPMPTGQPTEVTIPLYFEGHVYRAGSQIKVTIAAPNGTQPIWSFDQTQPPLGSTANESIAFSSTMPSSLTLPVVSGVGASSGLPPCCVVTSSMVRRAASCWPWASCSKARLMPA